MIDKPNKTPKEIAQAEVLEECGYDVPLANFEHVITHLSGVGIDGENMHLYYTEVTDQMRVSKGGGLADEGEMIDVIELSREEVHCFLNTIYIKSPLFTIFGVTWFLSRMNEHKKNKLDLSTVICISVIAVVAFSAGLLWNSRKKYWVHKFSLAIVMLNSDSEREREREKERKNLGINRR